MLKLGGLSSKFSAAPGDLGKVMPTNSLKPATYLIGFSLISSPLFMLGVHSPTDTQEMNTEFFFFHSSKVFWRGSLFSTNYSILIALPSLWHTYSTQTGSFTTWLTPSKWLIVTITKINRLSSEMATVPLGIHLFVIIAQGI